MPRKLIHLSFNMALCMSLASVAEPLNCQLGKGIEASATNYESPRNGRKSGESSPFQYTDSAVKLYCLFTAIWKIGNNE